MSKNNKIQQKETITYLNQLNKLKVIQFQRLNKWLKESYTKELKYKMINYC